MPDPAAPSRRLLPPARLALAATALAACLLAIAGDLWSRLLPPLIGHGLEVSALLTTLVTLGLSLGFLLQAVTHQTVTHQAVTHGNQPATYLTLASSTAGVALWLAVPYALGDTLAVLALLIRPLADAGDALRLLGRSLVVSSMVLPATLAWGALFRGLAANRGRRHLGQAFAAAGAGLLGGAVVVLSGLIPKISVLGAWRGVTVLLLGLAALSATLGWRSRRSTAAGLMPFAWLLVGFLVASQEGPSNFSRHAPIATGHLRSTMNGPNDLRRLLLQQQRAILWGVDGKRSGISLAASNGYTLRIDGVVRGGLHDAAGAVMSGLVGAALHDAPKRALVIGLGDGISSGWLAQVPSIEQVDVAEIEPATERVAALCAPLHRDVSRSTDSPSKVRRIRRPGRKVLRSAAEPYDLILVSDPRHAGHRLMTTAASRLATGGLFLQRLDIDSPSAGAIHDALAEVFPVVEVWQVQTDGLVLVAAAKPLDLDLDRLRSQVATEPYAAALDWLWGVEGLEGFLTGSPSRVQGDGVDPETVADLRRARDLTWGVFPTTGTPSSRGAFQAGDLQQALIGRPAAPRAQTSPIDRLLLAESSAEFADDRVPDLARMLRARRPVEAAIVLARWQLRRREPAQATHHLLAAFTAARQHPWVFAPTLQRAFALAQEIATQDPAKGAALFDALAEPFAVRLLDDARLQTRIALAPLLNDTSRCTEAFGAFEPHPSWDDAFLHHRWRCYQRASHPLAEQAGRDLRAFRDAAPPSLETGLLPETR